MKTILIAVTSLSLASGLAAAELYSESFDTEAAAKVVIFAGANTTTVTSVDYSNFSIGATTHSIPEAPSRIPGSAATRGFLMRQLYNGSARIINVLLADSFNGAPTFFQGSYRLKFDMFLNCAANGVAGTTEAGLFGIANYDNGRIAYTGRTTTARGTWGWLTTEGGIGSTGDTGLYDNNTRLALRENVTDAALFQSAFSASSLPAAYTPARNWTRVEIVCVETVPGASATVSTYFNGVKFCEGVTAHPAGFAVFGYEDAFPASNSDFPESQFALVDNVTVEELGPYELWVSQYLGVGANEARADADADGDGVPNLIEYVINTNPTFHQEAMPVDPSDPLLNSEGRTPLVDYLPSPSRLRLSFVRRIGEFGAGFFFDVATSTGGWLSLDTNAAVLTPIGGGWEFVQLIAPATVLGPAADKTFFGRLKVTKY